MRSRIGPEGCWLIAALPALAFIAAPIVALLQNSSVKNFIDQVRDDQVVDAIGVSLRTSSVAILVIVVFGLPLAIYDGRFNRNSPRSAAGILRQIIRGILLLPAVLPPAAAGLGLLFAFGRQSEIGGYLERLGVHVAFSPCAVVLAQVFVAFPFFLFQASAAFARHEDEIDDAAAIDGAGAFSVIRKVLIPVHWRALVGAALLSWARALGEFGATLLFAGSLQGRTRTLPLAIYLGFETDLSGATTVAIILLMVASAVLLLSALVLGFGKRRLFT